MINSRLLWIVVIVTVITIGFLAYPRNTASEDATPNSTSNPAQNPTPTGDTVTDIDGNVYRTVKIGNQIWMAENLKTTHLNDGTPIPNVIAAHAWDSLLTSGYCWYNNDISNKATYGGIYNWYAVNTGKLAPQGWHVPTKDEWLTLISYLGGVNVAGGKLKEVGTLHWASPNTGATDEVGFTALPSGYRGGGGMFVHLGGACFWWSSTEESAGPEGGKAWRYSINYLGDVSVSFGSQYFQHGWSIRCVKD